MPGGTRSSLSKLAEESPGGSLSIAYHQCLLCWSPCSEDDVEGLGGYPQVAGAEGSVQLRRQLSHWFILRRLLDVPRYWCEERMMESVGGLGEDDTEYKYGGGGDGPDKWFQVCGDCLSSLVTEAWRVHEQILKLEGRMREIKEATRRRIKDNYGRGRGGSGLASERVAMEIRRLVVPEIDEVLEKLDQEKNQSIQQYGMDEVPDLDNLEDLDLNSVAMDDDPNDDNWSPSGDEDTKVCVLEEDNQTVGLDADNPTSSTPVPDVKPMRVRGKDKKKRKRKTVIKGIKRGPYRKKEKPIPPPKRVRVRRRPPPKEKQVAVKQEEGNGGPPPAAAKPKSKPRGKDKQKRKSKPRIRKDRPKRILYPCTNCSSVPFVTPEELESHQNLHEERNKLNQVIDEGPASAREKLDCDQCTFPARDAVELKYHMRTRHSESMAWWNKKSYPCPLCPKNFPWASMEIHLKSRHGSSEEEAEVTEYKNRHLKCDHCDFLGSRPIQLTNHTSRHHNQKLKKETKPLREDDLRPCKECGVICASDKELKYHLSNKHNRADRFVCDECGAGFPFQVQLRLHKAVHNKHLNRDFVCDVCGVDFKRGDELTKHLRKYHEGDGGGGGGKMFKCRHCDLTSPFNAVIRKHIQTHKESGEHRCDKCGKCYINAPGLKRHLRINHNESGEEIKCPHCLRGFPSREYMMVHIKRYCKVKGLSAGKDAEAT